MLQDVLFESEEFAAAPVLTPQQESHYLQAYLPLVRKVVRQLAPQCNCIIDRQDMEWQELAEEGISHEDYLEYQQLEGAETLASLDELLNGEGPGIPLAGRDLEDQFVTQQMLQHALSQLSEKEQLILSMYYQHEMTLKEIALVLGLTEARICQLNKQIAQKIRDFVYPN